MNTQKLCCCLCRTTLKGELNFTTCRNESFNAYGRFVGVEGFWITDLPESDEKLPGWITGYCKDCWTTGILGHDLVKSKLEALEKLRCDSLSKQPQKVQEREKKIRELEEELREQKINNQQLQDNFENKTKALEEERDQFKIKIDKIEVEKQNLSQNLSAESQKVQEREQMIKALEGDLSKQKAKIQEFEASINDRNAEILKLKDEIANERNTSKQKDSEISNLKDQIVTKERNVLELSSKLEVEKQEAARLDQTLVDRETEFKKVFAKNKELEEQKSNVEVISDVTPSLSIQIDTLLDLNSSGWLIKSHNYEQTKKKDMITVAIIGMYDVGKSWFCNEFTGKTLFTSGSNQRTDGLDYYFPTENCNLIGVIDTPGSNEAIRCTQEDLVKKLEAVQVKKEDSNVETLNETLNSNEKAMLHYKLLKNDARILQDLKEKFIGEMADVLILLCNKLSEKEQENIFKVIKYHNKIKMERARAQEKTSSKRETLLYIVHNYKMLTEIEQVEKQIKRDLKDSFEVKECPLFNTEKDKFKGCHQLMYQDQFGITHLILAAKGSNAGKYYNPSTFGFLKGRIDHIEHRTSADVKNLFLEFCNRNIPIMLKQESIKLQLSSDQSAIVKVDGCPDTVLENLRYDEFGDFSVSAAFEPRYSVIQRQKDTNTTEIVVEVDLIHSTFTPALKKDSEGYWCLSLQGEKKISELKQGELNIRQDRERGSFNLMIRLLNLDCPKYKRDPEKGTKDGVVSYIFEFDSRSEQPLT